MNDMKHTYRRFVPFFIKRHIRNIYAKFKYGIKIGRDAYICKSVAEDFCKIGNVTYLSASFIGRASYIGSNSIICGAKIGRYCAIGDQVRICLGRHPTRSIVSIHPCFYSLNGNTIPSYVSQKIFQDHLFIDSEKKYVCSVGNDVWIGNNVSIMDGIIIGNGAIIGTGAVVTHDVEPYSIVAGIPAKKIGYRFSSEQIEFLNRINWWDYDEEWLKCHAYLFSDINKMMEFFRDA